MGKIQWNEGKYNEMRETTMKWWRWKSFITSREHLTFVHLSLKKKIENCGHNASFLIQEDVGHTCICLVLINMSRKSSVVELFKMNWTNKQLTNQIVHNALMKQPIKKETILPTSKVLSFNSSLFKCANFLSGLMNWWRRTGCPRRSAGGLQSMPVWVGLGRVRLILVGWDQAANSNRFFHMRGNIGGIL